jgi:hypothetical protein
MSTATEFLMQSFIYFTRQAGNKQGPCVETGSTPILSSKWCGSPKFRPLVISTGYSIAIMAKIR